MTRPFLFLGLIGCIWLATWQDGTIAATPAEPPPAGTFEQAVAAYDKGDFPAAFALFKSLAKSNDPAVLRNLGHMTRRGLGTPKDLAASFAYYLRAAEIGLPTAQLNVANAYETGTGVGKDLTEARHWRAQAAKADHPIAHHLYGQMLAAGHGGPVKQQAALVHLTRAYEQGVVEAFDDITDLMAQLFAPPQKQATPTQPKNTQAQNQPPQGAPPKRARR